MNINEMEESLKQLENEEEANRKEYEKKHPQEFKVKRMEWRNSEQKEARRLQAARYRERYASIRKEAKRLEAIELQKLGFLPAERKNVTRIKIKKLVEIPLSEKIQEQRTEKYFAKIEATLITPSQETGDKLDQELFALAINKEIDDNEIGITKEEWEEYLAEQKMRGS